MLTPIGPITSGNILSGQVGWPHASSGIANSGKVGNNAVVSGSYSSGSFAGLGAAFPVASGTFNGFELGSGSIVSGRVASGQIGFRHLADNSVQSGTIASGQVSRFHLSSGSFVQQIAPLHRLSSLSGVAVVSGGQSGCVDVYLVPFKGNVVQLIQSGTNLLANYLFDSATCRRNLSGQLASGQAYDVFVVVSGGGAALDITAAWTNASGVRNPGTAIQFNVSGGFTVQSGDPTRRIVGTIYAMQSGFYFDGDQGGPIRFGLTNADNRVHRGFRRTDPASGWQYSTAAWRLSNANSGNQVDVIQWDDGQGGLLMISAQSAVLQTIAGSPGVSIGENSTTSPVLEAGCGFCSPVAGGGAHQANVMLTKVPSMGRKLYSWLEAGTGAGTQSWFGQNVSGTYRQGFNGSWEC